jgi:hypothetical protein
LLCGIGIGKRMGMLLLRPWADGLGVFGNRYNPVPSSTTSCER